MQITVAETLGMEGRRGAYYDTAGALRDMVQNHMLQLLCLIAMEPPSALDAQSIRDEKVKVLRALAAADAARRSRASTVRGQYGVGERNGEVVKGYRQEEGVDPQLDHRDLRRAAHPHRQLALGRRAVSAALGQAPRQARSPRSPCASSSRRCTSSASSMTPSDEGVAPPEPKSNLLVLRIQPDEGISLSFACKRPGMQACSSTKCTWTSSTARAFQQRSPEAYERLLLDALRGDAVAVHALRRGRLRLAVHHLHPSRAGRACRRRTFPNYYPFTDGPDEANRLLEGTQARWRPLAEM